MSNMNNILNKIAKAEKVELAKHEVQLALVDDIKKLIQEANNNKNAYSIQAELTVQQLQKTKIIAQNWRDSLNQANGKIIDLTNSAKAIGLDIPQEIVAYKEVISKNLEFKNCHKDVPAYVIVTGPSLKNQNLLKLEGELVFTVNSFYKHEYIKKINPRYIFFLDSNLFNSNTIKNSNFYVNF